MKIKGGAIIPMGKIIQNTTQYSLDSLTLLVSLDKNGEAKGALYEDAGDGFQYRKGEFLISTFKAKQTGSSVRVVIKSVEGKLKPTNRNYKVCIVTDNGTLEGKWTKGTTVSLALPY